MSRNRQSNKMLVVDPNFGLRDVNEFVFPISKSAMSFLFRFHLHVLSHASSRSRLPLGLR